MGAPAQSTVANRPGASSRTRRTNSRLPAGLRIAWAKFRHAPCPPPSVRCLCQCALAALHVQLSTDCTLSECVLLLYDDAGAARAVFEMLVRCKHRAHVVHVVHLFPPVEGESRTAIHIEKLERDLGDHVALVRRLPPEQRRQFVRSMFEALAHIHSLRVAHMDLKPVRARAAVRARRVWRVRVTVTRAPRARATCSWTRS